MNKEYYKSGNTLIFIIYSLFFLRYSFRQACLPLLVPTPTPFRFLAVLCTAFPIRHKKIIAFATIFGAYFSPLIRVVSKKSTGLFLLVVSRFAPPTPTPFRFLAVLRTAFPIRHKKNSSFRYYFWCLLSESNQGHRDFQSLALPTELSRHYLSLKIKKHHLYKMATRKGLEPSTSSVTG